MEIQGDKPSQEVTKPKEAKWFGFISNADLYGAFKVAVVGTFLKDYVVMPAGNFAMKGLRYFETDDPETREERQAFDNLQTQMKAGFNALNEAKNQNLNRRGIVDALLLNKGTLKPNDVAILTNALQNLDKKKF